MFQRQGFTRSPRPSQLRYMIKFTSNTSRFMKNSRHPRRKVLKGRKSLPIRGLRWKLVLGRPPENRCDGLCVYDTRTLYVRPNCQDIWATTIHETLHAALPDLREECVMEVEEALVRA